MRCIRGSAAASILTGLLALCMASAGLAQSPSGDTVRFEAEVRIVLEQEKITDNAVLNRPRDLAFDPSSNGAVLLVVNRGAPYRIDKDDSYQPNEAAECKWRYGQRTTPKENSRFWPSFTKIENPGTENQQAKNSVDPWGIHFLAEASSIAFGVRHVSPRHHGPSEITEDHGRFSFGTCGESRNEMKGCADWKKGKWHKSTLLDFQGPTLWSTDPKVFARKNPVADKHLAKTFCNGLPEDKRRECEKGYTNPEGGMPFTLGSHLDMLHDSPMCMGIAWEQRNAYWVFDGCGGARFQPDTRLVSGHGENFETLSANLEDDEKKLIPCKDFGDIVRYDFRVDHGAGFDDHCDGLIERYAIGQVKRVDGVPSHMLMWSGDLFIADSGNRRIARLNPEDAGGRGPYSKRPLGERVNEACTVVWEMKNAKRKPAIVKTYFELDGASIPSGIAVYPEAALPLETTGGGDVLVVSDNAHSMLLFITLNKDRTVPAQRIGFVDLSGKIDRGGLMGVAVQPGDRKSVV